MNQQQFHKMRVADQLAKAVEADIQCGRYGSDGKLPPMREVARDYSVGLHTVQDAWNILKDKGVIDTTPRSRGRVVTGRSGAARRIVMPYAVKDDPSVLTSFRTESFGHQLVNLVRRGLRDHDVEPVAHPYTADDPRSAARMIESWRNDRRNIAGMVASVGVVGAEGERFVDAAESMNLPWVSINPSERSRTTNFVGADHFHIGALAGRLMGRLDKRDIVFVTNGLYPDRLALAQFSGLTESLEQAGPPWERVRVLRVGDGRMQDSKAMAYRVTLEHLRAHGVPEVFVGSDVYLRGILDALRDLNLRVPRDTEVLGLTGSAALADGVDPPLTTIDTPIDAVARRVVEMVLTMVRDNQRVLPGCYCAPDFTVRQSLAVPPSIEAQLRGELREAASRQSPEHQRLVRSG